MALLNIFKGKKGKLQKRSEKDEQKRKNDKPSVLPKKKEKIEEIAKAQVSAAKPVPQTAVKAKGDTKTAPNVLQFPRVTEKATFLQENGQYIFRVFSTATKPEIKKSIEEVYGVDVLEVRVINMRRKSKRLGRSRGFRPGYKKAIVKIKNGQSIEVMPR